MEAFPASRDLLGKSASAYQHLRRSVVLGHLRPGRRLSATDLASVFRISVTPVREALVRMAAEGFVAWEESRGYFTKPFTHEEQQDLHDVLAINMVAAVRRIAEPPRGLLERVARCATPDGPVAIDAYGALLDDLAAALAAKSGNGVLAGLLHTTLDQTQLVRHLDLQSPERLEAVVTGLRAFAAALMVSDNHGAVGRLADHLAARRARLPSLAQQANALAQRAKYP